MPNTNLSEQFTFGSLPSLGEMTAKFWGPAFEFAAVALTIYIIIGAFRFLISGGDKNAVEGAKNMITHAVVGFILLIMVFLIFQYLPSALGFNFSIF